MCTSWAVKLLMELPTADRTHSPKRETQIPHDLKKDTTMVFLSSFTASYLKCFFC